MSRFTSGLAPLWEEVRLRVQSCQEGGPHWIGVQRIGNHPSKEIFTKKEGGGAIEKRVKSGYGSGKVAREGNAKKGW